MHGKLLKILEGINCALEFKNVLGSPLIIVSFVLSTFLYFGSSWKIFDRVRLTVRKSILFLRGKKGEKKTQVQMSV